jgi:hypothetical protein
MRLPLYASRTLGVPCGGFSFAYAPLAQLDRASGFEPEGRGFESLRARFFVSW